VLRAHAHQDCPFERLVEALGVERDPAVTPVHQALFSVRKASERREAAGLVFEPAAEVDAASAKTDLAVTVEQREGDWLLDLSYATDLFDAETLERFGEHFENLLAAALDDPAAPVHALELLSAAERRTVLQEWSGATPDYPRDLSVPVLFEHAVRRHADDVAVVMHAETLTSAELNRRVNRLSRHLTALGVQRGSRVALCVDRSFDMVVALLAIMKAGAAFVPLDPSYPSERLFTRRAGYKSPGGAVTAC
jgi:non-ribosomal peptide synthetase component F